MVGRHVIFRQGIGRPRRIWLTATRMNRTKRHGKNMANKGQIHNDGIVLAIRQLLLGHNVENETDSIVSMIKKSARQSEAMQRAANFIYDICMEDRHYIPRGSKLCSKLAVLEVDEIKYFRRLVMARLQKDFEERERLRNTNSFLNRIEFVCRIFRDMRLPDGSPLKVLVPAICEYLKMLVSLTSSLEECKVFSSMLSLIGKEIDLLDNEKMSSVLAAARSKFVDPSACGLHQTLLLNSLELAAHKWEPFPAKAL